MGSYLDTQPDPDNNTCDCVNVTKDTYTTRSIMERNQDITSRPASSTIVFAVQEAFSQLIHNQVDFVSDYFLKSLESKDSVMKVYKQSKLLIGKDYISGTQVSVFSQRQVITLVTSPITFPTEAEDIETLRNMSNTDFLPTECPCQSIATPINPWYIHGRISALLLFLTSIVILVANGLVIASIISILSRGSTQRSSQRLKTGYIFVFNLAVADMLVGLVSMVYIIINTAGLTNHSHLFCLLHICFTITPCVASVFNMTVIGIDRYVFIRHPLKYDSFVAVWKGVVVIIIIWIASILLGFSPLMGWRAVQDIFASEGMNCSFMFIIDSSYIMVTLFGIFLPQLILIVYLYYNIFKVSRKHNREISRTRKRLTRLSQANVVDNLEEHKPAARHAHSCPVTPVTSRKLRGSGKIRQERRKESSNENHIRTVSFGPSSFENEERRHLSMSGDDGDLQDCYPFPHTTVTDNHDEVFITVELPGTAPHLNKVDDREDRKEKKGGDNTPRTFPAKLRRTISYSGNVAVASFASQVSSHLRSYTNLRKGAKRNLKALRTVALVIGFFFAMWSPFLIVSFVQSVCGGQCHLQDLVGTYLLLLGLSNSAINPIVYTYTNRELKKHMFNFCRKQRIHTIPNPSKPAATSDSVNGTGVTNSKQFLSVPANAWSSIPRSSLSSSVSGYSQSSTRTFSISSITKQSPSATMQGKRNTMRSNCKSKGGNRFSLSNSLATNPNFSLPPSGKRKSLQTVNTTRSLEAALSFNNDQSALNDLS